MLCNLNFRDRSRHPKAGYKTYQNNKVNSLNSSINVRVMKNPQNLGRTEYDSHYPAKAQA